MLVLSRKEDQKILIPGLDISIKIICCKNSSVRLGIDAPPQIRILRDELEDGISVKDPSFASVVNDKINTFPMSQRHDVRDQFNVVAMALQMLLDDIDSGQLKDVNEVFNSIHERLRSVTPTPNDSDAFVLVVEDQANERELLAGILRMNGYRVATADDGNAAMEYIKKHGAPSFILVDMHMPHCDGKELVRQIRSSVELNNVRVYVVSGSNEKDCDISTQDIDGWYTKPLAPQKLIHALATA